MVFGKLVKTSEIFIFLVVSCFCPGRSQFLHIRYAKWEVWNTPTSSGGKVSTKQCKVAF